MSLARYAFRVGWWLLWSIIGSLAMVASLRLVAHDRHMSLVWLNAVSLYLYLPAYGILAVAAAAKRWRLSAASGVVIAAHLCWIAPLLSMASEAETGIPEGRVFRLFSTNLMMINPEPQAIIDEIVTYGPDVLLLQEFSPRWRRALDEAGITRDFPRAEGVVREDSFGIAIYASTLIDAEVWDVEGLPMVRGRIDVDGEAVRLINVHTLPPRRADYTEVWNRQMQRLVDEIGESTGPLVVVGDFNATPHSAWYQRITATRMRDCHVDRGRGLATTFPNDVFPLPPLRLDHVFVSPEIACLEIREGEGEHSDHQPLLVRLGLRDPR